MRIVTAMALWAVTVGASLAEERIVVETPDGFALNQELSAGGIHIRDYLPEGQTGADWREMLSVQRFDELSGHDPRGFLENVAGTALTGCDGASADLIAETLEDGVPVAVTVMSCPYSHATGGPETFVTKVLSGEEGLYVVQASWRGGLENEALQRWLDVLLGARLCDGDLEETCRAG